MPGLLDGLMSGQWTEDPEQNKAITSGLLNFGLQLMQTRGKFGPGLGQAGMAGIQGFNQVKQQQHQSKLQKLQLDQLERQKMLAGREDALANLPSQFIKPETQGNNPSGYMPPRADIPGLSQAFMAAPGGLQTGLALQAALAKQEPKLETIAPGARAGYFKDGKFNEVASNPREDTPPSAIKEYQFAVSQGYKGTFDQWDLSRKKATGTNIRIDNKLGEGLAKEVGPMIAESAQQAQGALQQVSNADSIIKAVESNKIFAGPGANVRLKGAQIGQVLGVGGKDAAETVANTRAVIQGLARATVAARAALKGQGQVSDFEGRLLAKAESGDIEDMTPSEIKQIAQANKRLGLLLVDKHRKLLDRAKANPSTAGVADFFEVAPPETVRKYNPATGQLE